MVIFLLATWTVTFLRYVGLKNIRPKIVYLAFQYWIEPYNMHTCLCRPHTVGSPVATRVRIRIL